MIEMKPSEIFYSQDSINNIFDERCRHSGILIGETLDDICEGRCSIYNIPTIRVINRDGKWVTCDNRRLWVFRHLERLGKCDDVPVQVTSYIPEAKLTSYNGGKEITVRRRPGGNWHCKQSKRQNPPTSRTISTNRNIYGLESPSPRPVSNTSTTVNTLNNITNFQHVDRANKIESSVKPATPKPIYCSTVYPYDHSTRTIQSTNTGYKSSYTTGTGYSPTQSALGRTSHVQEEESNRHRPIVNTYATPQTNLYSNRYGVERNRETRNESVTNIIRPNPGASPKIERKTTHGLAPNEINTRSSSPRRDDTAIMVTDYYSEDVKKPCCVIL